MTAMENIYDIFISYKRNRLPTANCRSCSNVMLLRSSFGVPLVLLWLSYRVLKWIRGEFKEDLKIIRRYALLTNLCSLPHESSLHAPRTYVYEAMNIGGIMMYRNNKFCRLFLNN